MDGFRLINAVDVIILGGAYDECELPKSHNCLMFA